VTKKIYELLLNEYYISCFSNYGNLLSQWRAYGDINIGFDRGSFEFGQRFITDKKSKQLDTSGVQFCDCHYINENDEEFIKTIEDVGIKVQDVAGFPNNIDPYHLLTIALLCFSKKHSGFKEEAESRLIAYLWNRDPFENNGKSYLKCHFEASQVIRIVVGPSNNHQSNIIKIQDFIKNNPEYEGVQLFESGIPFKSL